MEKKTVVQGGHGPVPMEENSTRYIDAEPVSVPMTAYYLRRMMSGELVEYEAPAMAPAAAKGPVAAFSPPPASAPSAVGAASSQKAEDK